MRIRLEWRPSGRFELDSMDPNGTLCAFVPARRTSFSAMVFFYEALDTFYLFAGCVKKQIPILVRPKDAMRTLCNP